MNIVRVLRLGRAAQGQRHDLVAPEEEAGGAELGTQLVHLVGAHVRVREDEKGGVLLCAAANVVNQLAFLFTVHLLGLGKADDLIALRFRHCGVWLQLPSKSAVGEAVQYDYNKDK